MFNLLILLIYFVFLIYTAGPLWTTKLQTHRDSYDQIGSLSFTNRLRMFMNVPVRWWWVSN